MGYLFLGISLLAGATKGFCGKTISGKIESIKGTFYVNMIRMLLCVIIGFFVVMPEGLSALNVAPKTLMITAVSGISTSIFVASWIIAVKRGAFVMLDVFLTLGVGITVALCRIFFSEPVEINQYIGYFLLIIAAYIMCSYSSRIKGGLNFKSFLILVLCGVANGLSDFSQKWFVHTVTEGSIGVFNFYTYVFSSMTLILLFLIENKIEKKQNDGKSFQILFVLCIMAVCLFANSYFKVLAARYIDSATLYPLSTGMALIFSVLMASLFFKEKATARCIVGAAITFAALVIMNL